MYSKCLKMTSSIKRGMQMIQFEINCYWQHSSPLLTTEDFVPTLTKYHRKLGRILRVIIKGGPPLWSSGQSS
jgi:hypothetical protein